MVQVFQNAGLPVLSLFDLNYVSDKESLNKRE